MQAKRDYPDHPFVGVSAIILCRGHILLIKRGKPPMQGIWSLPGGAVESGEPLKHAIMREVKEETGLDFAPQRAIDLVEVIQHDDQGRCSRHFVLTVFIGTVETNGEALPALMAGDDASEAQWIEIASVEDYALTEGTGDVIRRALSSSEDAGIAL